MTVTVNGAAVPLQVEKGVTVYATAIGTAVKLVSVPLNDVAFVPLPPPVILLEL